MPNHSPWPNDSPEVRRVVATLVLSMCLATDSDPDRLLERLSVAAWPTLECQAQ